MYLTVTLLVPTVCLKGCLSPEKPTYLCKEREVKFPVAYLCSHSKAMANQFCYLSGPFLKFLGRGWHRNFLLPTPFTFCSHPFLSDSQFVVVYPYCKIFASSPTSCNVYDYEWEKPTEDWKKNRKASRLGRKRKYYRYIQIYDFCAVSKKKVILQMKNGLETKIMQRY